MKEVTHRSHEASKEQSGDVGTGPSAPTCQPRVQASASPGILVLSLGVWGVAPQDTSPFSSKPHR